jgi:hypothetical protein
MSKKTLPPLSDVPMVKVSDFAQWVGLSVSTIEWLIAQKKLAGVLTLEGEKRNTYRVSPWLAVQSLGLSQDEIAQLGDMFGTRPTAPQSVSYAFSVPSTLQITCAVVTLTHTETPAPKRKGQR